MEVILAVRRPSWSSEGHFGVQIGSDSAASADCTRQDGGQEVSKRPGWAAQTGVQSPNWAQEAPETLQEELKRHPRGSKLSPRGLQELQVDPKSHPRRPEEPKRDKPTTLQLPRRQKP